LANAEIEDAEVKKAIKIIAQGINRIAGVHEREEQRNLIRYEEQRVLIQEQRLKLRGFEPLTP